MPAGHYIPNMMENESFAFFYTRLKNLDGAVNFKEVAKSLSLKNAAAAKGKLDRIIKAQEKTRPSTGHGVGKKDKAYQNKRGTGRSAKGQKRKRGVVEGQAEAGTEDTLDAKEEAVEQGDGEGCGDDNSENSFEVGENGENAEEV